MKASVAEAGVVNGDSSCRVVQGEDDGEAGRGDRSVVVTISVTGDDMDDTGDDMTCSSMEDMDSGDIDSEEIAVGDIDDADSGDTSVAITKREDVTRFIILSFIGVSEPPGEDSGTTLAGDVSMTSSVFSQDGDDGDDVIATSSNKAVCNIDFSVLDMMVKSAFIMLT